jgi:hypothetical protein
MAFANSMWSRRGSTKVVVVLVCCGIALAAVVFWPKRMPFSINPRYAGCYWGNDWVGRHFYRVIVNDEPLGWWEANVSRPGYNRYRGYYPDGTLREEGEIMVTYLLANPEPFADVHQVKWGKYYRPDGTLGSEVRDGTGEQTWWYLNGKPRWRLAVREGKRVLLEHWDETGDREYREWYDDSGKTSRFERRAKGQIIQESKGKK